MIPASSQLPQRLGRYEIVERIAAGGMGEVYVARFLAPGGFVKPVALKCIHPHLASDEVFINMLHDEANVAANIRHPNVVGTVDVGAGGGRHYVVFDFVSGETLSRLIGEMVLRGQLIPEWVVAWIGAEIASALHAAHTARSLNGEPLEIIHRDVSPHNVMLSDLGHPMLFDFGVAKARQRVSQTTQGQIKGKFAYMPPEVFAGAPVDCTVDTYALGVMLYELLTGVQPFVRDTDIETIVALESGRVEPMSAFRPGLLEGIEPIVLRAMAYERANRYASAQQLEHALRIWAQHLELAHDAASVARWLEQVAPDRIQERNALLRRVATHDPDAPLATSSWAELPDKSTTPSVLATRGDRREIDIPTRTLDRRRAPPRSFAMASIIAAIAAVVVLTALFFSSRNPQAVRAEASAAESSSPDQGRDASAASVTTPAALSSESIAVPISALPPVEDLPPSTSGSHKNPAPPPGHSRAGDPSQQHKPPLVRSYE